MDGMYSNFDNLENCISYLKSQTFKCFSGLYGRLEGFPIWRLTWMVQYLRQVGIIRRRHFRPQNFFNDTVVSCRWFGLVFLAFPPGNLPVF